MDGHDASSGELATVGCRLRPPSRPSAAARAVLYAVTRHFRDKVLTSQVHGRSCRSRCRRSALALFLPLLTVRLTDDGLFLCTGALFCGLDEVMILTVHSHIGAICGPSIQYLMIALSAGHRPRGLQTLLGSNEA